MKTHGHASQEHRSIPSRRTNPSTLLVEGYATDFDIGAITQEVGGEPESNGQAPYDERVLEASERKIRYAFFFLYVNLTKPLLTPAGPLQVPKPTKQPAHLKDIEYESP